MRFEPQGNRLLVQMQENQDQISKGGIVMIAAAQERSQIATVIARGPGKVRPDGTLWPVDIRVGDKIVLGKYSGSSLSIDGVDYMVLDGDEVLGVLRD